MGTGGHLAAPLRVPEAAVDVRAFVAELLQALATVAEIDQVALRSEGPIIAGRAFIQAEMFLEFYIISPIRAIRGSP